VDRIDLFRTFVRVVECSSFTRAADTLGIPRSSASAAVKALEDRMGTRLLHRTTRRIAPTQDGLALLERCQRLVADMEEAEGLFRHAAAQPSGRIRVDVPGRIGRLVIAPALPAFLERYSKIDVDLGVTDRAVNLIEEGADCVLRVGAPASPALIARPVGALQVINVGAATYFARHGVPRTPDDLAGHWAINYASPTTGRVEDWEWIENGVRRSRAMRARVTVNSAEAHIACCLAGAGLIQVPAYDVRPHLESGNLVEVLPQHRAAPMTMTLLFPQRPRLSRRVQVFVEWLEQLLLQQVCEELTA